jgi:hypothetical protein
MSSAENPPLCRPPAALRAAKAAGTEAGEFGIAISVDFAAIELTALVLIVQQVIGIASPRQTCRAL